MILVLVIISIPLHERCPNAAVIPRSSKTTAYQLWSKQVTITTGLVTTHGPPIPPPPLEHETASLLTVQHSTSRCADRRGIPPPRHQSPRRGTRARAGQRRSESGQRARHRSLSLCLRHDVSVNAWWARRLRIATVAADSNGVCSWSALLHRDLLSRLSRRYSPPPVCPFFLYLK
jgi:hypothetical protein